MSYARYRNRSVFYQRSAGTFRAYGVAPNYFRKLDVDPTLLRGSKADERVDMRDRDRLELLEAMRHPRERDFYQDHTYHNPWIARELDAHNKAMLHKRYAFFGKGYERSPWIWFPGDMVEVTHGEGTGQRGAIIAVIKYKNEILVQNVNVQTITLPATDSRPEQLVQREHPVNVDRVRHVDPSTNQVCTVRLVTVRGKDAGGALEEKRISLETGTLLPIPPRDEPLEVGDPLRDTPIQDAEELTYDSERELAVLTERKLRAIEDHFVGRLKTAYEFHTPLAAANDAAMRRFQFDVLRGATRAAAASVAAAGAGGAPVRALWADEVAALVRELEESAAAEAAAGVDATGGEEDDDTDNDDVQSAAPAVEGEPEDDRADEVPRK